MGGQLEIMMEEGEQKDAALLLKGTGPFFETLSVGSVPGADHS